MLAVHIYVSSRVMVGWGGGVRWWVMWFQFHKAGPCWVVHCVCDNTWTVLTRPGLPDREVWFLCVYLLRVRLLYGLWDKRYRQTCFQFLWHVGIILSCLLCMHVLNVIQFYIIWCSSNQWTCTAFILFYHVGCTHSNHPLHPLFPARLKMRLTPSSIWNCL